MTNRRIFILGASGFIGKYLKGKLSADNSMEVLGYSSMECNLLSLSDVQGIFSSAGPEDALVITAGITRTRENSYDSMIKNVQMIENVCRAVHQRFVGHITFLSTIDVYGVNIGHDERINENVLVNPNDYYSISKIISEYLIKQLCSQKSIPLAILRLSGVYGPGDDFKSTVGMLVNRAINDQNLIIYNHGENLRDFVYVDDIYKIIQSTIKQNKSVFMNVATGKSFSIKEIVTLIKKLIPFPIEIQDKEKKPGSEKRIEHLQFDCSVLEKEFPYVAMTDLKAGVTSYIAQAFGKGK